MVERWQVPAILDLVDLLFPSLAVLGYAASPNSWWQLSSSVLHGPGIWCELNKETKSKELKEMECQLYSINLPGVVVGKVQKNKQTNKLSLLTCCGGREGEKNLSQRIRGRKKKHMCQLGPEIKPRTSLRLGRDQHTMVVAWQVMLPMHKILQPCSSLLANIQGTVNCPQFVASNGMKESNSPARICVV